MGIGSRVTSQPARERHAVARESGAQAAEMRWGET